MIKALKLHKLHQRTIQSAEFDFVEFCSVIHKKGSQGNKSEAKQFIFLKVTTVLVLLLEGMQRKHNFFLSDFPFENATCDELLCSTCGCQTACSHINNERFSVRHSACLTDVVMKG